MNATEKPVCSHCGSEDVRLDAWAAWDNLLQRWTLAGTQDQAYCEQCEGETLLKWEAINQ